MHSRYRNFFCYWMPVILYCLLIFNQSSNPVPSGIPSVPHIDKLLHAVGYAVLGILFFRAFRKSLETLDVHTIILLSVLSSTLYGLSDELHQYYIPYRTADINDFLADMIGSFLGTQAYYLLTDKIHQRL